MYNKSTAINYAWEFPPGNPQVHAWRMHCCWLRDVLNRFFIEATEVQGVTSYVPINYWLKKRKIFPSKKEYPGHSHWIMIQIRRYRETTRGVPFSRLTGGGREFPRSLRGRGKFRGRWSQRTIYIKQYWLARAFQGRGYYLKALWGRAFLLLKHLKKNVHCVLYY